MKLNNEEARVFEEYADAQGIISSNKFKVETLKEQIVEIMQKYNCELVEADYGKFSLNKRRVWEFPDYVEEANNGLKKAQSKAKRKGDASYEEIPSLRFTQAK